MPDLPTLTVTPAQAARIQNAYGGAEQYRTWLRQAVRDYVILHERKVLKDKLETDIAASDAQVQSDLSSI